jgi:hypothetical protein
MRILISKTLFLLLFIALLSLNSYAKKGYHIEVTIKNTKDTACYLGYPYGEKKYLADTATINDKGTFIFEGDEPLDGGVYFIYHPNSIYFDIIMENKPFTLVTDTIDYVGNMKTEGSEENKLFFDFQKFMKQQHQKAESLSKEMEKISDKNSEAALNIKKARKELDSLVQEYYHNLIENNPDKFVATYVKSTIGIEVPEGPKDENGKDLDPAFKYKYYKAHYFDNIDFSEEKMLRTPMFYNKIMDYLDKLTVKHPDSVAVSARHIIEKAKVNKEVFRYCVVTITYKYETSNIMGMDGVFVDLAEHYYLSGDAFWADSALIQKITDRVKALKPNLIGKTAPSLIVQDTLMKPFSLHQQKFDYALLYFYSPDCGHCKKKTPDLVDLYDKKIKANGGKCVCYMCRYRN